jgi:DNA-binding MarR family transcriptional regulator
MNRSKKTPDKALQCGPLEKIFNSTPSARILDFLTTYRDYDYSKQDIAKYSGVSPRHAVREIEKLEKLGLLIKTRNSGHSHMYKYNTQNEAAALLDKFGIIFALQECEELAAQEEAEEQASQQQPEAQPEQELLTTPA